MPDSAAEQERSDHRGILRHFLATLAYRTSKALKDAPDGFGRFQAGGGVRSPEGIVRHMTGLLTFSLSILRAEERPTIAPLDDLTAEAKRFYAVLEELSDQLDTGVRPDRDTELRLVQGPLSDAMTHAGQLSMLRRLSGSPIPVESFFEADITVGLLDEYDS